MRVDAGHMAVPVEDCVVEIFDLVGFDAAGGCIKLADLVACGLGGLIVGLLASAAEFEAYDTRELVEAKQAAAAWTDGGLSDETADGAHAHELDAAAAADG